MNAVIQQMVTGVVLLGIAGMAAVEVFYRYALSRSSRRRSAAVGPTTPEDSL